jgi:hypothetical protein
MVTNMIAVLAFWGMETMGFYASNERYGIL